MKPRVVRAGERVFKTAALKAAEEERRSKEARADMELVERFKGGDGAAFEKLVSRYENRLFNMGRRMCGHEEDAREILQETFWRLTNR